jgi:hypothetical protein
VRVAEGAEEGVHERELGVQPEVLHVVAQSERGARTQAQAGDLNKKDDCKSLELLLGYCHHHIAYFSNYRTTSTPQIRSFNAF